MNKYYYKVKKRTAKIVTILCVVDRMDIGSFICYVCDFN